MTLRKLSGIAILLIAIVLLAGCSMDPRENPIDPSSSTWDKFVYPFSASLDFFAKIFWNEYGLAILALTIIIRLLILPLMIKQYRSTKQMQALQPEILKIRKKYKDDPQKQQEETMKLFQKHGVNPLAGCMPLLIQMPILIALYNAIMRNEHIYEHTFLWMQLGERDPFFILPTIAAITTYLQQKMMSSVQQMNPQMEMLMVIFPILIFVTAMTFPAALPLYWIFSNLFTIVQTYFMYVRNSRKEVKGGLSK